MPLKPAAIETAQSRADANTVLINLIFTQLCDSAPDDAYSVLHQLRRALDSSPQLHPEMRGMLEDFYMTFAERLAPGSQH